MANANSNDVSVLLGDGSGRFSSGSTFKTDTRPLGIAAGDVHRDGRTDLVVANGGGNTVWVFQGDGSGRFTKTKELTANTQPRGIVVADIDNDGRSDIAVANQWSNDVSILKGDGAGGFASPVHILFSASPVALAAVDFNRDGRLDLAVLNQGASVLTLLMGTSDGSAKHTWRNIIFFLFPFSLYMQKNLGPWWLYFGENYQKMVHAFCKTRCQAMMAVYRNTGRFDRSNAVLQDGLVAVYDKKVDHPGMDYIDYGISILTRAVLAELPAGCACDLADLYAKMAQEKRLCAHEVQQRFYEIGSPQGLKDFEDYILRRNAQ